MYFDILLDWVKQHSVSNSVENDEGTIPLKIIRYFYMLQKFEKVFYNPVTSQVWHSYLCVSVCLDVCMHCVDY